MKNYYTNAIVLVIGIILGGSGVYGYQQYLMPAPAPQPLAEIKVEANETVSASGILVKDQPDLKPGVWFVSFSENGQDLAVELGFDDQSRCFGKTSSGKCAPDKFAPNREIEVKGIVSGDALLVRELRFPVPLAQ